MAQSQYTPKVAVVTPYYGESLQLLEQCHQSVVAQTIPCLHVVVADGHRTGMRDWNVNYISLQNHSDIAQQLD